MAKYMNLVFQDSPESENMTTWVHETKPTLRVSRCKDLSGLSSCPDPACAKSNFFAWWSGRFLPFGMAAWFETGSRADAGCLDNFGNPASPGTSAACELQAELGKTWSRCRALASCSCASSICCLMFSLCLRSSSLCSASDRASRSGEHEQQLTAATEKMVPRSCSRSIRICACFDSLSADLLGVPLEAPHTLQQRFFSQCRLFFTQTW